MTRVCFNTEGLVFHAEFQAPLFLNVGRILVGHTHGARIMSDLSSILIPIAGFIFLTCYCIGVNAVQIDKAWRSRPYPGTKHVIAIEMTEP